MHFQTPWTGQLIRSPFESKKKAAAQIFAKNVDSFKKPRKMVNFEWKKKKSVSTKIYFLFGFVNNYFA